MLELVGTITEVGKPGEGIDDEHRFYCLVKVISGDESMELKLYQSDVKRDRLRPGDKVLFGARVSSMKLEPNQMAPLDNRSKCTIGYETFSAIREIIQRAPRSRMRKKKQG